VSVGIVIAILVVTTTLVPSVEHDPQVTDESKATTAAEAVEDFLLSSGWLPQPGTDLAQHTDDLAWTAIPDDLARRIINVTVQWGRGTSGDSLLMSLLDDDPTCTVEVETNVTLADGQKTRLTV